MWGIIIIYACIIMEEIQVETKFIFLYTRVLCYNTVVYMLVLDKKEEIKGEK